MDIEKIAGAAIIAKYAVDGLIIVAKHIDPYDRYTIDNKVLPVLKMIKKILHLKRK